jgi:hypothetical protein
VAGGCAAVEADDCAGAAGTAGVETGFAGVDGSAGFDATTLGYHNVSEVQVVYSSPGEYAHSPCSSCRQ